MHILPFPYIYCTFVCIFASLCKCNKCNYTTEWKCLPARRNGNASIDSNENEQRVARMAQFDLASRLSEELVERSIELETAAVRWCSRAGSHSWQGAAGQHLRTLVYLRADCCGKEGLWGSARLSECARRELLGAAVLRTPERADAAPEGRPVRLRVLTCCARLRIRATGSSRPPNTPPPDTTRSLLGSTDWSCACDARGRRYWWSVLNRICFNRNWLCCIL